MTSPHLITQTSGLAGGGTLFLALDGSNQALWTPTGVLVPNLNADLLDGKNTGTSGNTIPLLDGVNTWSADQSVPDEAYGPLWNGSFEVPTKNAIYDIIESILVGPGPFIRTDGTSITTASIPFALGLSVPDNTFINIGGTSDVGGTYGQGYIRMRPYQGGINDRYLDIGWGNSASGPSSGSTTAPGIFLQAGSTTGTSTGDGGTISWVGGTAGGTSGFGGNLIFSPGTGKGAGKRGGILQMTGGFSTSSADYGYVKIGFTGTPGRFTLSSSDTVGSLYINKALEVDSLIYGDGGILVGSTIFDANTSTSSVGIGQVADPLQTLGITSTLSSTSTAPEALNIAHELTVSPLNTATIRLEPHLNWSSSSTPFYAGIRIDLDDDHIVTGSSGIGTEQIYGIYAQFQRSANVSSDHDTIAHTGHFISAGDVSLYNRTSGNTTATVTGLSFSGSGTPQYNDGGNGRTLTYNLSGIRASASFFPSGTITGTMVSTIRALYVSQIQGNTSVAGNTSTIYGLDIAGPTTAATSYGINVGAASATTTAYGLAIAKPTTATTIYQVALDGSGTGSGVYFNTPTRAGLEYIRSTGTGFLNLGAGTSIKLDPLTTNGFVKTNSSDGTLSVGTSADLIAAVGGQVKVYNDTNTYTAYNAASDSDAARGTALLAAQTAAVSGELIQVESGAYTISSSLGKNGVNWFFKPGAVVTYTGNANMWDDTSGAMTFMIGGDGTFISQATAGASSHSVFFISNAASDINVVCKRIQNQSNEFPNPTGIYLSGNGKGTFNVSEGIYSDNYDVLLSTSTTGVLNITTGEMLAGDDVIEWDGGTLHLKAQYIYSPTGSGLNQISGDSTLLISDSAVAIGVDGGSSYVHIERHEGNAVIGNNGGDLSISIEKMEQGSVVHTAGTTQISATNISRVGGTTIVVDVSGGTLTLNGVNITNTGSGVDLRQTAGTFNVISGRGSGTSGKFTTTGTINYAAPLPLDMADQLITNIGNSGTDFTSGGGLTLAGALQANNTVTVGANTVGHDVKFFGDTSGAYFEFNDTGAITTIKQPGRDQLSGSDTLQPLRVTGGAVISIEDFTHYATAYTLSLQSNYNYTYLEILNNAGAGAGVFFGVEGGGVAGDLFSLYNFQGGGFGVSVSDAISGGGNVSGLNLSNAGNFTLSTYNDTTYKQPNGWLASFGSKQLQVKSTSGARDAAISVIDGTATNRGGHLWYDASATTLFLDSLYDNAAGIMSFRVRTNGTPVTPLSMSNTMATFTTDVTLSKTTPTVFLTDAGGDDWSLGITAGAFALTNRSDSVNPISVSAASTMTLDSVSSMIFSIGKSTEMTLTPNTLTFEAGASDVSIGFASSGVMAITATSFTTSGTITSSGDITISKATPLLQFTDSGGDDYSIDVGGAGASIFRIRSTTDNRTEISFDGAGGVTLESFTGNLRGASGVISAYTPTLARFTPLDNMPLVANYATLNTRNNHAVLEFDDTTAETAVFTGILDRAYNATGITITIIWTGKTATSGNVVWNAYIERIDTSTDIDSDSFAAAQTATGTANGTSGIPTYTTITMTDGAQMDSLAVGEAFRIKIERDAASGSDTMTGDGQILAVEIKAT